MTLDQLLARPFGSYGELIRLHARHRPNHPALVEGERRVSFATLDAMMDRVAIPSGLPRSDRPPGPTSFTAFEPAEKALWSWVADMPAAMLGDPVIQ